MIAGRFVLLGRDDSYCTSFDTWEECAVCFEPRIPAGFKLRDDATGREWLPGAAYEWEAART